MIKKNNAYRAVGNAANQNPLMIIIPCHRLIGKNDKISGYAFGQKLKRWLLDFEKAKIS